jgi:hypothetical protein
MLAERLQFLDRTQEVAGSSPASSTYKAPAKDVVRLFGRHMS